MGRNIFEQSESMQRMFVEGFDNAISYYRSIEDKLKTLTDEVSDTAVNGNASSIQRAYDDLSRAIDEIRNESV